MASQKYYRQGQWARSPSPSALPNPHPFFSQRRKLPTQPSSGLVNSNQALDGLQILAALSGLADVEPGQPVPICPRRRTLAYPFDSPPPESLPHPFMSPKNDVNRQVPTLSTHSNKFYRYGVAFQAPPASDLPIPDFSDKCSSGDLVKSSHVTGQTAPASFKRVERATYRPHKKTENVVTKL